MKKKFFGLVIFLGVLSTFFVGTAGCHGSKDKDKSSSSAKTSSSTQDTAAPPASSKK